MKDNLTQFDLHFPGNWIEGQDRDWAWQNDHVLGLIESLFVEAVTAYSLFRPITAENFRELFQENETGGISIVPQSPYERCLNALYAKAFVFALDGVEKLISCLCKYLHPPVAVKALHEQYRGQFGHLKLIRDSAIHLEDRGRCKTRFQKPLQAGVIILGSFIEKRFMFTGEDGKGYEVEISDTTLHTARRIIQEVINAYPWA
jgi:hypothetical protein